MEAAYYQELIRPLVGGRRVVLCGQLLNGSTALVETLRALGAERCLVLAHGIGTGRAPSPDDADQVVVETRATNVIQEFRQVERLLARPPAAFLEALSRFDPDHRALTLAPPISIGPLPTTLDGRRFFGRRQPVSLALEDKVAVDAFWDGSGVARAPSAIVPPTLADVAEAANSLDRGQGVVVAADAREGIHGGAEGLRWARDDAELAEAADFFRAISDRVRVMPFLEGIPCSIHGIVFPDHVVTVRPVEMVTLRQPPRLRYCGAATFWDPPRQRRTEMREVARSVGERLRETIGYRGAFTIDGIMTEQGFLPTELNPRFGAGLGVIGRAIAGLPLGLLQLAIVEGLDLDYRPADLEEMLVAGADEHRSGGAWTTVSRVFTEMEEVRLARIDGGFARAAEGEEADATLSIGPSNLGGFVRFAAVPERTPTGISIAPRAVAFFAFADRELETGIGPLEPARELGSG
ncbi:MAG TPA: ATP-grasp domain-containing protein [Candidatus Dormibacteraeota bacterium]|nr:ATP-grasp domain-containing protein [Candidatus Dormibacteraeota bacterium]